MLPCAVLLYVAIWQRYVPLSWSIVCWRAALDQVCLLPPLTLCVHSQLGLYELCLRRGLLLHLAPLVV